MAEKVKLSKDGNSIDFVTTDNIPTSMKKFRQSPEIEGFYRFIYENDLQKEAFEILERIVAHRKVAKKALKQEAAQTKKMEQAQLAAAEAVVVKAAKAAKPPAVVEKKGAPAKVATKTPVKAAKPAPKAKAKPTAKASAVRTKPVPAKKKNKK